MSFVALIIETLKVLLTKKIRSKELLEQLHFFANQSLVIVLFCVSFASVVTILESSFHMKLVIQNDSMVPGFAAMLILRELGAVVTALLLTSRVGAGIAAEVGTMKTTEQIDALKLLGVDPIQYIVVPRLIAGVFGGAVLTVFANMVCLAGAYLVSNHYLGFTSGLFMTSLTRFVSFSDLFFSMIKGACFGAVIPLVSCYFGFKSQEGADGVGLATTQSVVFASVTIIVLDFILSYIFSMFY